jgi:glycosyltransferase involved in cell wall biosynthesis
VKRIVMLGSGREVRGGISAMVNVCFDQGLFDRWEAQYLPTHCDGTKARKAARALASFARFAGLVASGRVALVHAHIASGASFWRKLAFIVLARAFAVPYVLHVHAGDFGDYYERLGGPARALLRWLYRGAQRVIALSPAWREPIATAVPEARIDVIPNPVAIPTWNAHAAPRRPVALFLGVVRAEKGVYDLLAAWPRVLARLPEAQLVIAGSGEVERARALAQETGFGSSVEFPGWVGPEEKARLLAKASTLVLPSHFEALPMAVLEGMAAGLPIVATRVGAIPDAVGEGAGLLVEPQDPEALAQALVTALGDGAARIAMGATARLRARETYSAETVVPALERIWAGLASDAKRTSSWMPAGP